MPPTTEAVACSPASTITASTIRGVRFRFGGVAAAAGDPGLAERLSVASAKSVVGTGPVAGAATLGWAVGRYGNTGADVAEGGIDAAGTTTGTEPVGAGFRTGRGGPVGPVAQ